MSPVFVVYLERYDNETPCGRVLCSSCMRPFDFKGLDDLCFKAEAISDYLNEPPRSEEKGEALNPECRARIEALQRELVAQCGLTRNAEGLVWMDSGPERRMLYCFTFRLLFRKRWSWQGLFQQEDIARLFGSVLELMLLAGQSAERVWQSQSEIKAEASC